jgi:hypothetical protein
LTAASAWGAPATDPVEGLIASEKASYQEWLESAEEPPAAYLPATRLAVEIFSPAFRSEEADLLCDDPDLPELIELTGGDSTAREVVLNLSLPRVRGAVGEACLVRPGDRAVAVGRGWQVERSLAGMIVQQERPACPEDPPHGLWMTFDEPLPEEPLFVTTDPAVQIRDNLFIPAEQVPVASAGPEILARFKGLVRFPEDYVVTLAEVRAPDLDAVVLFERRAISSEDDGLPAMIAAAVSPDSVQVLWAERIDARRGSGRFEFVGTLDFDGDGYREIVFSGVHQACPYTVVFRRGTAGYEPLPLLTRACRC